MRNLKSVVTYNEQMKYDIVSGYEPNGLFVSYRMNISTIHNDRKKYYYSRI